MYLGKIKDFDVDAMNKALNEYRYNRKKYAVIDDNVYLVTAPPRDSDYGLGF